jgi:hypothetical protein
LDVSFADGVADQLGGAVDFWSGKHVGAVALDGFLADVQKRCDLFARPAGGASLMAI